MTRRAAGTGACWPRTGRAAELAARAAHRLPRPRQLRRCVRGRAGHVIVMCSQGYASSLAAASLQDIGLVNATDLAGGFLAWAAAGLPGRPGAAAAPLRSG